MGFSNQYARSWRRLPRALVRWRSSGFNQSRAGIEQRTSCGSEERGRLALQQRRPGGGFRGIRLSGGEPQHREEWWRLEVARSANTRRGELGGGRVRFGERAAY